ncbi:MAG TPA: type 4a pilus biogenesis protein PilO [Thermoanaerobaculia bacterium]
MALELKLEERKWWVALVIGLVFGIAVAGAVEYAWFRGIRADIVKKRSELHDLQEQINKGRAAERKLSQFREEVKRLELELAKLLQILPSARNTEELIKRIETLTRQGDFSLRKFTPGDPVAKDFYSEYPIEIALDGTYHNLALFFDRMSRFSRIINVEDLRVWNVEIPGKSIGANFTAKTFIYTADESGAAMSGKPGGKDAPGAAAGAKARALKARAEGKGVE